MMKKSIWAVVAGVLFIIAVMTLVDIVLHVTGIFPSMDQPITDAPPCLRPPIASSSVSAVLGSRRGSPQIGR